MLSIKNLTKIYKTKGGNDTRALDNVTVSFPETGMIFLLGKSGSGKSTLLNVAGGLDFPTSGEIILKGRSSKDFSQSDFDSYRNTYIGFIFQEYNVLNEFNIEQNIALALELQGKKATKEAVEDLLAQVDMVGFGKRKPNTLSGGQKQRIAIARALIKEPNIIMADEPTGALDSKTGEQVFETLKKLSKDKLVIVVSHDHDFAERFGDRIIELKDGKIISDISKHQVEAKPISENVTIINENAIRINDAKKLTKAEFDKLYKAIKDTDGQVFISSGANAEKSMKVARISPDGQSDEFKKTESVKLKVYDGSQTKFIRSKMPVGKSIKMGLSSLKTKPVRLIFTIFLSVISFTMFGVASSLMLYNPNHTYSEALQKTDYLSEVLEKRAKGKYVSQELDESGKVISESKYDSSSLVNFGKEEISKLNENNLNLVYIPVGQLYSNLAFSDINLKKYADYYNSYYRISYISDASESDFEKLGYKLEGSYPSSDDEILLPKIYGQMLIDSEAVNKPSYLNIIGDSFNFNFDKTTKKMTISGFFDAGNVPEVYLELKNLQETNLTEPEIRDLQQSFPDYMNGSFNSVVFVSSKTFDENVKANTSTRVETYDRSGMIVSRDVYQYDPYDYGIYIFTEEIVRENAGVFAIYDLDDKPIDSATFTMEEDEIYLPEYEFNDVAFNIRRGFLEYFLSISPFNDDWTNCMRYMPTYYDYYVTHTEEINNIRDYIYYQPSHAVSLYNMFSEEFVKAYKISELISAFTYPDLYEATISDADKDLIFNARSCAMGENTVETVDRIYKLMEDNFDTIIPNYLHNKHITYLYSNCSDSVRFKMESDEQLMGILSKDYKDWDANDLAKIEQFIDENIEGAFRYPQWNDYESGYTFADYKPVGDAVFSAAKDLVYYYKDYANRTGELKVKGYYYSQNDSNYAYILNKNFVDYHTMPLDNGHIYRYFFETEYEIPADAKYANVMVKTNYTQEQIAFMMKSSDSNVTYSLTSTTFISVNFIVELISVLKNIFFWSGVGFGIFAALMLLNFITVSVAGKKKDIGILRAIGARKSDVFKIFFVESLFIAAVCSLVSIITAFIVQFAMDRSFIERIGVSILQFSPITIGLIIAIAVVISFIATIIPVINASRKPPVESIRAL